MSSQGDVVLVDVRQAAALAGRTPETVRRWVWSGRLTAQREGRRLMVARDDVLTLTGTSLGSGAAMSLREWAADLQHEGQVRTATTASDLIAADRAGHPGDPDARR